MEQVVRVLSADVACATTPKDARSPDPVCTLEIPNSLLLAAREEGKCLIEQVIDTIIIL